MHATLEAVPDQPLVCHYGEAPRFAEEPHPAGERWEIGKSWEWFYLKTTYGTAHPTAASAFSSP